MQSEVHQIVTLSLSLWDLARAPQFRCRFGGRPADVIPFDLPGGNVHNARSAHSRRTTCCLYKLLVQLPCRGDDLSREPLSGTRWPNLFANILRGTFTKVVLNAAAGCVNRVLVFLVCKRGCLLIWPTSSVRMVSYCLSFKLWGSTACLQTDYQVAIFWVWTDLSKIPIDSIPYLGV